MRSTATCLSKYRAGIRPATAHVGFVGPRHHAPPTHGWIRCVGASALFAVAVLSPGCAKDAAGVQSSFARSSVAPRGDFERIAVLDFEGAGGSAFADLVAQEFMKAKFTAVERSALHSAIGEREIRAVTNESLDLDALRFELGGVLLARVLIVGALVERTDALEPGEKNATGASGLLVTCRAIDPKTGQVLWTGSVKSGAAIATGDYAGPLTAWRLAAQEIVCAYRENAYTGQAIAYEAERIPR